MSRNRTWQNHSVLCPFYKEEDKQQIICEGVEPGNLIHMTFSSPTKKAIYRCNYCQKNYKSCIIEAAQEEAAQE